jgi:peptidoglycan/xylan/chitin deacetylase (PgdA/CDA1 family)
VDRADWQPEASEKALRRRPLRVLARPWTERRFLHRDYGRLLRQLADESRFLVVPLREFSSAPRDRVVVALRHDVEERFRNALEMAALEAEHGIRTTYFMLHTAPYYGRTRWQRASHDESLVPGLRRLQEMGHEVGWHNDLVTLQCVYGIEPRGYLAAELAWLRENGIDVTGSAKHGSYWARRLDYDNNDFFADFEEVAGRPSKSEVAVGERRCVLAKGRLAEFGLDYEAYHLGEDHYFSDGRFDANGSRWHPDQLDLEALEPGDTLIVLTHPDYWDPSVARKALRTVRWSARKLVAGERAQRLR